ncbi:MAG: AmmeMemoRadiSam system protein A [Gammaproteobacteria bacterium]|nr:AmmeMemoRadiSam system protein A [Gammaproteobacteria bacterium]MDE2345729.1 AmmeMemoRadiSam system protein A [Gammaproteobacteria bacterium]
MKFDGVTRSLLLMAALHSIEEQLRGSAFLPDGSNQNPVLRELLASFVTLKRHGALRGCIGTLDPRRALLHDVVANARAAAFEDPRFPPLAAPELENLQIEISVLTTAESVNVRSRADLLLMLNPHVDGLTVQDGRRRATFLPSVWESLPEPDEFYAALMRKAGLGRDYWSSNLKFFRYHTESFCN